MSTDSVTREQGPDRFEISTDGTVAGFTQFVDSGPQRIFFHTEIGREFGGRGLAGTLVGEALERTRSEGLRVVPVCPYVAKYLTQHPEFADVADPVEPASIEVVKRARS